MPSHSFLSPGARTEEFHMAFRPWPFPSEFHDLPWCGAGAADSRRDVISLHCSLVWTLSPEEDMFLSAFSFHKTVMLSTGIMFQLPPLEKPHKKESLPAKSDQSPLCPSLQDSVFAPKNLRWVRYSRPEEVRSRRHRWGRVELRKSVCRRWGLSDTLHR